jgi:flagellar biosynthesis/type III secretory pathway protein FliH
MLLAAALVVGPALVDDIAAATGEFLNQRAGERRQTDKEDSDGGSAAYRNGYRDGWSQGREAVERGERHDPTGHRWYREARRGYEYRHGTRYAYIERYRAGFEAGYTAGYRSYRRGKS